MSSSAKGEVTIQELDRAQQAIARRSAEARATIPDIALAAQLRRGEEDPPTARLLRACALALREVPRANGAYRDGRFELYSRVNVGVGVMSESVHVIPTVFDADLKPTEQLAAELTALRERALAGRLTPPELAGATFTLWDMRELGISSATPLLAVPQAAAIAAGAGADTITLTLACDHRILYGALAARLLRSVCGHLAG